MFLESNGANVREDEAGLYIMWYVEEGKKTLSSGLTDPSMTKVKTVAVLPTITPATTRLKTAN